MKPLARLAHARATLQALVAANFGTWRGAVRLALAQLEWIAGRVDGFVAPPPPGVERLVFVCLGNINRSAFADWVAQAHGARTCSLGLSTSTGIPAFATAVETARRHGIDLGRHRATDLADYAFRKGDLLLAMEIRHVHRLLASGVPASAIRLLGAWSSPRRLHLHDPHTLSDTYFVTCFTLLHAAVIALVAELRAAGSASVAALPAPGTPP